MDEQELDRALMDAVTSYWEVREKQGSTHREGEERDSSRHGDVAGGAHLNAMAELLERVFVDEGFNSLTIRRGSGVEVPGFFRATKRWDLLVFHDGVLVAAIEIKSQGSSVSNNYNNRTEEAIGSAFDLRTACRQGLLGPARPWLGYLFVLDESPKTLKSVKVNQPSFEVDQIFFGASYKRRYEIFCRRLVEAELYNSTCLVITSVDPVRVHPSAPDLSLVAFARAIGALATEVLPSR
jgi:hypothetical protein